MCPRVFNGDLSIVSEKVPGGSIVDWHSDETMPTETARSIVNTSKEHCQVVSFSVKLLFERRDGLVVWFGSSCTTVGVVEVQDSM